MSIPAPGSLPHHWCGHCRNMIGAGCACGLPQPLRYWSDMRPRRRSVVGTTLLVLLTVFVVAPILLIGGCAILLGAQG